MENTITFNKRVDIADILRGFAIMGIIILHAIEHFNFYSFPDTLPFGWFAVTDKIIWEGLFFLFGGKCYAIFALLFGFSFFIQDDNQRKQGKEFRLRFLWRLFLLFLIGNINAAFFTGEILVMYAILGVILVLVCRLPDKIVFWMAVICLLQPFELYKIIYAFCHPEALPAKELAGYYFAEAFKVQSTGTFLETVKMNLWVGQLANFTWAWEHGRIFQTTGLFMFGMLAGRYGYFLNTPGKLSVWLKVFGIALLLYFPLTGLTNMAATLVGNEAAAQALVRILKSLSNLAFMLLWLNSIIILYYYTSLHNTLLKLAPYGKMSLTHYLGQSIIGSFLFYHWGLHLQLGITYSFFVGIALFLVQYGFSVWWLKHHKQGPFEGIWKKLTWAGTKH